jgi:hypothetical protein
LRKSHRSSRGGRVAPTIRTGHPCGRDDLDPTAPVASRMSIRTTSGLWVADWAIALAADTAVPQVTCPNSATNIARCIAINASSSTISTRMDYRGADNGTVSLIT